MMAGSTLAENDISGGSGADVSLTVGDDFTMGSGSEVSSSRDNPGGSGVGGNIAIAVGGDLTMAADTLIRAEGQNSGAGNILIDVEGNMTMAGSAGPLAGAKISAAGLTPSDTAGNVTIHVGNFPNIPPSGVFIQEDGAVVTVSSPGPAGEIIITSGREMEIDGHVLSESGQSGTGAVQPRGGGPITLQTGCLLTISDTGLVSSKGQDPGADLVHLEGCDVFVYGVVRSYSPGAGHAIPTNGNRCNDDTIAHPPSGADGFTGCVEIWGKNITIDNTGTHNGEVHTDGIRNPMRGWVDVIAESLVEIKGDPTTPYPTDFDANAFVYTPPYAVHANACPASDGQAPCSNSFGGLITVLSQNGKVLSSGRALQANAYAIGSDGGDIRVEAGGAMPGGEVDLDDSSLQATGPTGGTNPAGGSILVRSWEDDVLGVAPGELKVAGDGAADPGTITLTACGDVNYTGTTDRTPTINEGALFCDPDEPTPHAGVIFRTELWEACEPQDGLKTGHKFKDLDGDGIKDDGEPGLAGVEIHLFNAGLSYHAHTLTDGSGNYSFTVPAGFLPGSFTACETVPAGYTQTFPNPGTDGANCDSHPATVNGPVGLHGYTFPLAPGQTHAGNDFGNFPTPVCEKGPVKEVLHTGTGRFPGNKGPGHDRAHRPGRLSPGRGRQRHRRERGQLSDRARAKGRHGAARRPPSQELVIDDNYAKPFGLIGCSVTLTTRRRRREPDDQDRVERRESREHLPDGPACRRQRPRGDPGGR